MSDASMQSKPSALIVDTATLAVLCDGISVRRIQQLAEDGVFSRMAHGQYDALACVPAFIRHKLAEAVEKAARTPAEERIRELRADALALKLERDSGALVTEAQAAGWEVFEEQAGQLRAGVMGVPARHVKDLDLRRKLEADLAAEFGAASKRAGDEASGSTPPNRAARRAARVRSKR